MDAKKQQIPSLSLTIPLGLLSLGCSEKWLWRVLLFWSSYGYLFRSEAPARFRFDKSA